MITNVKDIKHCFYINLESRDDRRLHIEQQLLSIGVVDFERFNAIQLANGNGALGCSMSHLKCLETAKKNGWPYLLICEDDTTFLRPAIFAEQFQQFLQNHNESSWDVVLLAGNNVPPYTYVDKTCVKVSRCQTTTAYFVKGEYFDTLIQNIKEGIQHLLKEPEKRALYAIDKYWFRLQERDNWFLITPLTVVQKEGYSDIEKRVTDYRKMMVDLRKEYLFRK